MAILRDPGLLEWEASAPQGLRDDIIWRFHAYRIALYLLHVAQGDLRGGAATARWHTISDQLLRSVASISANIGEGYGRSRPADRARYYDVALGSLREAASWYEAARGFLPPEVVVERQAQLGELRRILHGAIRELRRRPPHNRVY